MDKSIFNKFDMTFSGHFHKKSDDGSTYFIWVHHIKYIGMMINGKKFHIFDTETRELERVLNPYKIYKKVYYDDTNGKEFNYNQIEDLKDKIVKLIVVNKKDLYEFDRFVDKVLTESMVHDVKIIEDFSDLKLENVKDEIIENNSRHYDFIRKLC